MANEVAVSNNKFDLVTLEGAIAEAIAEEMDGLGSVPYDRVKIPSGGGLAFELPSEDGEDAEVARELVGVILHHHPVNAFWREKFAGGNEQPDCSSMDGKVGIDRETGECRNCSTCQYNQFGSDGNGKAPSAPSSLAFFASAGVSALVLTLRVLNSSAQPMMVPKLPEISASTVGTMPS